VKRPVPRSRCRAASSWRRRRPAVSGAPSRPGDPEARAARPEVG